MSASPVEAASRSVRPRILVVEDEATVSLDIRHSLKDMGFEVVGDCASGAEVASAVDVGRPDVVLMDICIRGEKNGIEVARELRAKFGLPVVFLTAMKDAATLDEARAVEPHAYLMKPFRHMELATAIDLAFSRHRLEMRLRERERQLGATLGAIAEGVITTDHEGKITFVNGRGETMLGLCSEAAVGAFLSEVVNLRALSSSDDSAKAVLPIDRVLNRREAAHLNELLLVSRGGEERVVKSSLAPVFDELELFGAVAVFSDVTRIYELTRQMEMSDRLAAVGTMAAGIAHEINNSLTYVLANLDFAMAWLTASKRKSRTARSEAMASLKDALQGATRIASIVAEMRTFTRHSGASRPTNIAAAINWAITMSKHQRPPHIRLEKQLDVVPLVQADDARLGQVFLNLLVNAAHAIGPSAEGLIRVSCRSEGAHVVAEVEDNGPGISPAVRARLFEPFFTTKPPGEGTGLGLSIAHDIVASLGGELTVESEPGHGARFRVRFRAIESV